LRLTSYYDVDYDMVYTAAAYHDTGLCEDRKTHHEVSERIIRADVNLRKWFTEEQMVTIAQAAFDHRASSDHEPRTIYGKIIAEADRQIDAVTVIRRTIQFGLKNYPELDREGYWQRTYSHLLEKYGDGGYLKLWIPESSNAARLEELRVIIRDKTALRKIFEELFDSVMQNSASGYTEESAGLIVEAQRKYFRSGRTLPVKWRLQQLRKLKKMVLAHSGEFENALYEDLGRSATEAYLCDIAPVIVEINEAIAGLRRWARPERHFSGLMCFPSIITKVYKMPYGVSLIVSPFNFPILLTFGVLAASIAGGNTAVIKASSKSSSCTAIMKKLIRETFSPEYITLVDGGHEVADIFLKQRFDKIFYTGSPAIGKKILAEAAGKLTPVGLELGGENGNWCIVRKDADILDAARKIAFFKLCNAGQICININQIAVAEEVAEPFLEALKQAFTKQIGPDPVNNDEYPKLISAQAYDKCSFLASQYRDRIIYGGQGDEVSRRYSPTIIFPVRADEPIVMQELFCPLLPVVPFKDEEIDSLLETIENREHPLAMYLFTRDMDWAERTMRTMQYGGGCINEVCMHLMVKGVPFNGIGHSGMGAYHGEWGFREFTHPQTVLKGSRFFNLSLREHPYGKSNRLAQILKGFVTII